MQHFCARLRDDGRWEYAVTWKRSTGPVGYCAGQDSAGEPAAYHSSGHETRGGAESCYRKYLLDTRVQKKHDPFSLRPCSVCQTFTDGRVIVDTSHMFVLCPKHQERANLEALMPRVTESWEP